MIGCETNDHEWRLTCTGNTWTGEIGNCTEKGRYGIVTVIKFHIFVIRMVYLFALFPKLVHTGSALQSPLSDLAQRFCCSISQRKRLAINGSLP